jgi:hypothetical protein
MPLFWFGFSDQELMENGGAKSASARAIAGYFETHYHGSVAANVRHHFVPQFYLRNFANDTRQRQIGLFNIPTGKFVPSTSIRDQAQRKRLYGKEGGEQALSNLEGASSNVLRRMIERKEVPKWHSPEHLALLVYVLFQYHRTPTAAAELEEFQEKAVKTVLSLDPRMAPDVDELKVTVPDAVKRSLRLAALYHHLGMDLRYKLLISQSAKSFVTSDHPVIYYNQFMEHRNKFGSARGLACKGLQIFLPLAPKCCLILFDDKIYRVGGRSMTGVQVHAAGEDVDALNLLQVANAGDQLFFDNGANEVEIRELASKAVAYRLSSRTSVKTYPSRDRADGTSSVLMHLSKTDLRTGLKLSNVTELPSARNYRLGSAVVHARDPILCGLHDEWVEKVLNKVYRGSEFGEFMLDRLRGTVRR